MPRHAAAVLRLTLVNGLQVERPVAWHERERELRRLQKAVEVVNEHVDIEALTVQLVEA